MSWRDRNWKYADAMETKEPGYLARKFKRIERAQKAAPQDSPATSPIVAPAVAAPRLRRVG